MVQYINRGTFDFSHIIIHTCILLHFNKQPMKGSALEEVFCHLSIYTIIDSIFECRYLVVISTLKPLPTFKSWIYARAI